MWGACILRTLERGGHNLGAPSNRGAQGFLVHSFSLSRGAPYSRALELSCAPDLGRKFMRVDYGAMKWCMRVEGAPGMVNLLCAPWFWGIE